MNIRNNIASYNRASVRNPRPKAKHTPPVAQQVAAGTQDGKSPALKIYDRAVMSMFGLGAVGTTANIAGRILTAGALGAGAATAGSAAAGLVVGYVAADAASAIFHWGLDNYPDGDTPIVGATADEFQIHHKEPHNLESGHVLENTALAGQFAALPMVAVALLNPTAFASGAALGFLGGITSAQASHRWTHMKKPGELIKSLQGNLLQGKKDHNDHHAQPHSSNYAIVNGVTNPLFDKTHFFRRAEKLIYDLTGKEPHTWKDTNLRAFAMGEITEAEYRDPVNRNAGRKAYKEAIAENYRAIEARKAKAGDDQ